MTPVVRMRVIGSILVVVSYFVLIHVDAMVGTLGHFVADGISIPYFITNRSWDVVIMLSFLLVTSGTKLIHYGFN